MDKESINSQIIKNVYHISSESNVALHKHLKFDEVFYCIKGKGYGVLENEEKELSVGKVFIVKENTMHSLRTESDLWVASFLIPVLE
jgi:quercetin dioxygenase-like cupin family protein